jgi:hypothetical protein
MSDDLRGAASYFGATSTSAGGDGTDPVGSSGRETERCIISGGTIASDDLVSGDAVDPGGGLGEGVGSLAGGVASAATWDSSGDIECCTGTTTG